MTARYPDFDGSQPCATVDPEAFFPETGNGAGEAKSICNGGFGGHPEPCAFLEPCFQYALHHSVMGVWAGTSAKERSRLRGAMGLVAQPLTISDLSTSPLPPRPGDNPAVQRVACNSCGKRLLRTSVSKHQRESCSGLSEDERRALPRRKAS